MKANKALLDQHLAQTTPFPIDINIASAAGIYLYDAAGKQYADMISGVGVSALGHGNPHIKTAINAQVEKHLHVMVYGEFRQEAQEQLAANLTQLLPSALDCCYFVNSGTEANEAALKLAKRVTGRTKMVAVKGGYHGSTHGSMSVSSNETKKSAFRPLLPEVYFISLNNTEDLQTIDDDTACVIMETIQGDAGVRIPDVAFMQKLRNRCTEVGALLILDEIQCGMGRAGSWFAFEQFNITPDILTLGKSLGAGMPIGAMISATKHMQLFTENPMLGHITTFGGHPVVCAAANAGIEVMKSEKLIENIHEKGKRMYDLLVHHPLVQEIRYRGLFFAIDLPSEAIVQRVFDRLLTRGIITFWFLSCPASFRIAPPFIITHEEIDQICGDILNVFDEISNEKL